jgi:hypothetical protein
MELYAERRLASRPDDAANAATGGALRRASAPECLAALKLCIGVIALLFVGVAFGVFALAPAICGIAAVVAWGAACGLEGVKKAALLMNSRPAGPVHFVRRWSAVTLPGIAAPAPPLPPPRA